MKNDKLCPVEVDFVSREMLEHELLSIPECDNIVLVVSKALVGFLNLQTLLDNMSKKYQVVLIDRDFSNPTQAHILEAVRKILPQIPELIVAIGGGSAIDLAKGISALFHFVDNSVTVNDITHLIQEKKYEKNDSAIPIWAIPTTAGTGSEVTKWATIWDYNGEAKYSVDMKPLYPQRALLCTELTMSMPPKLILSTALDAMSHAMEAYWARATSPVIQDIGYMAVVKIHRHLKEALEHPDDFFLREQLCRASLLAGIAFSNTRTTACHSISYPITMRFGVDHGFAVIMLLDEISRINQEQVKEIGTLLEIFSDDGGLSQWLNTVSSGIQQLKLSAFGIQQADIPKIASMSFTAGRMDNNPVDITQKQVEEILLRVL